MPRRLSKHRTGIESSTARFRHVRALRFEPLEARLPLTVGPELVFGQTFEEPSSELVFAGDVAFFSDYDPEHGFELWSAGPSSEDPQLVADIHLHGSSYPDHLTPAGDSLFFIANDGVHGREVWISNGTVEGTKLVLDTKTGSEDGFIRFLNTVNQTLIFAANDSNGECHLWGAHIDGAPPVLLTDICWTGNWDDQSQIRVDDRIYFVARGDSFEDELWVTDGTPSGTTQVGDLSPTGSSSIFPNLTRVGNQIYFTASAGSGVTLWRTDGTAAGTVQVQDRAGQLSNGSPSMLTAVGSKVFFLAGHTADMALWVSDGTTSGTLRLTSIYYGDDLTLINEMVAMNNQLFFVTDDNVHGTELWKSDGTVAGTGLVLDIRVGPESSVPSSLEVLGSELFFSAGDNQGSELWKTDGTTSGTVRVFDLRPGSQSSFPSQLTAVQDGLLFVANDGIHGSELYWTDGSANVAPTLHDLRHGADGSSIRGFVVHHDEVLFAATDARGWREIWRCDATAENIVRITDSDGRARVDHSIGHVTIVDDLYYLMVNDFTRGRTSLFRSDGTPSGTELVADITNTGLGIKYPTALGKSLFFTTQGPPFINYPDLWRSDGTAAGTNVIFHVADFGSVLGMAAREEEMFFLINNRQFVSFDPDPSQVQLWKAGKASAPQLVHEFDAYVCESCPVASSIEKIGSMLVFVGYDSQHGWELWKSDGTDAGTTLIEDIRPGLDDSQIFFLGMLNGKLLFQANDGVHGSQLWISDGTASGTSMVKEISSDLYTLRPAGAVGNRFVFFVWDQVHGDEPWVTDGTAEGTFLLRETVVGPSSISLHTLGVADDVLVMAEGSNLWRSDGTSEGTFPFMQLQTHSVFPPSDAVVVGKDVFFSRIANIPFSSAYEIWKTDGTEAGTQLLTLSQEDPRRSSHIVPDLIAGIDTLLYVDSSSTSFWKYPQHVRDIHVTPGGVVSVAAQNGGIIVRDGGQVVLEEFIEDVASVVLHGSDLPEQFLVEIGPGATLPNGWLKIASGEEDTLSTDSLELTGSAVDLVEYRVNGEGSGTVRIGESAIGFDHFADISDQILAGIRRFTITATSGLVQLTDDSDPQNNESRVEINATAIDFVNPSTALWIDVGQVTASVATPDELFTARIELLGSFEENSENPYQFEAAWRPFRRAMVGISQFVECKWHEVTVNLLVHGSAWQNPVLGPDVNSDGTVVPLDFLGIVNELNNPTIHHPLSGLFSSITESNSQRPFYDVDGNGFLTPLDGLVIVNWLNRPGEEGESAQVQPLTDNHSGLGVIWVNPAFAASSFQSEDAATDLQNSDPTDQSPLVTPPADRTSSGQAFHADVDDEHFVAACEVQAEILDDDELLAWISAQPNSSCIVPPKNS